jgi:superfamily II DNA or RNA helicase
MTFTRMGYYQQVCSIFEFESFNTAHQKKTFQSIINEKKDVFVNLTTGAGNTYLSRRYRSYIRCNIRI